MNKLLPLFFDLKDKSVLLVGAGRVALEKLEKLIRTEARITVVAPDIDEEILDLAYLLPERITIWKREYKKDDCIPFVFVIIATNNSNINKDIAHDCRHHGKLVNAVDDRKHCDFIFSAQIYYGASQIAVSSGGRLPGLTKALRSLLEEILPREHDSEIERMIELRQKLKRAYPSITERTQIFRHLLRQWENQYLRPKTKVSSEIKRSVRQ